MRVEAFETVDGVGILCVFPWEPATLEEFPDWDAAFVYLTEMGIVTDEYRIEETQEGLD